METGNLRVGDEVQVVGNNVGGDEDYRGMTGVVVELFEVNMYPIYVDFDGDGHGVGFELDELEVIDG